MNLKRFLMFIYLFFSINKNYFFEKYNFLSMHEASKEKFFIIWYLLKNQILTIVAIIVLKKIFDSDLLNAVVTLMLMISLLFGLDSKEWRLFYRLDFVSEIPNMIERFFTVLLGNVILKLIIENNIFLISTLFFYYSKISFIYLPIFLIIYFLLYVTILSFYFILQNSTLNMKKTFSIFNYLFSFTFTSWFIYVLLDFILNAFGIFINNRYNSSIFSVFINEIVKIININVNYFMENISFIIIGLLIIFVIIGFSTFLTVKYLNKINYLDKEDNKYITDSFFIVKIIKLFLDILYLSKEEIRIQVNKELSLFSYIYKYSFKDYFFVFIADRSMSFLIAIYLILIKYEYNAAYILFFILIPIVLVVDINSNVGVKLITNMSFITDYNTLLIANTTGYSIKKLIRSKLVFYYGIKSFSYILFIFIVNVMLMSFNGDWIIILFSNLMILIILACFPKLYLINNLIYSRMNYRNYYKYLDESKILDYGISEFYPLNIMFKIWIVLAFLIIIFTTIFKFVDLKLIFLVSLFVVMFTIIIVYVIMIRVYNNIIKFIERGNYSADFAKLFKE